jgi:hypothetical protein
MESSMEQEARLQALQVQIDVQDSILRSLIRLIPDGRALVTELLGRIARGELPDMSDGHPMLAQAWLMTLDPEA